MKGLLLIILSSIFFISGCCSAQLQLFSDGYHYYPDWCEYDTCRPKNGVADCYKNDEYVTTIKAWTKEEVMRYFYNQRLNLLYGY